MIAAAVVVVAALVASATACTPEPAVHRITEFPAAQWSERNAAVTCGSYSRASRLLSRGEELRVTLPVSARFSLHVVACGQEGERAKNLEYELTAGGVALASGQIDVPLDRWLESNVRLPRSRSEATLVLRPAGGDLAVADAWVAMAAPRSAPAIPPNGPRILLLSVDTLRADALEPYGGSLTPAFARLAAESEVWTRHYATSHWTKPSHASLLTGHFPDTHGASTLASGIDPGVATLAERLRGAGLTTFALVDNIVNLSPRWGFARGFDEYRLWDRGLAPAARQVAEWIEGHSDRPFFAFVHTFEAHSDRVRLPYESPAVDAKLLAERFGAEDYGCRRRTCASALLRAMNRGRFAPSDLDREILPFLYQEGVRNVDARLGELFDRLRSSGVWDDLWVIVTSDHGEELLERGGTLHNTLFEENVRVPLFVKPPGRATGSVEKGVTSSIDLAPTLLALAGLQDSSLPGTALGLRQSRDAVLAGAGGEHVLVAGQWKLHASAGAESRLYDLDRDAGEVHDLRLTRPDVAGALTIELERLIERARRVPRSAGANDATLSPLSTEERDQLRALGYL